MIISPPAIVDAGDCFRLQAGVRYDGRDERLWPWGSEYRRGLANDANAAHGDTLAVGSFRPAGNSPLGLSDMAGNVAEWTLDCMNLSYLDAPSDGSAWGRGICSSRMTRGGSWFTGTREIRLPARFNLKNGDRNDFTGFRVVRRVEES